MDGQKEGRKGKGGNECVTNKAGQFLTLLLE